MHLYIHCTSPAHKSIKVQKILHLYLNCGYMTLNLNNHLKILKQQK
jgi:hypothetical protein